MPNRRPTPRNRTGSHPSGHALRFGTRPSVVQPSTPTLRLSDELTTSEVDAFLVQTSNRHLNDLNERENFNQIGQREASLPYDVKPEPARPPAQPVKLVRQGLD
jgi:hypothetical protein